LRQQACLFASSLPYSQAKRMTASKSA